MSTETTMVNDNGCWCFVGIKALTSDDSIKVSMELPDKRVTPTIMANVIGLE